MTTRFGCEQHAIHDCGCPGYPNLQTALRDCGGLCQIVPHSDRCIRCQAARLIDTLQNRNARYLDRILDLQNEAEHNAPPAGYLQITLPIGLIETIIETDRILFALEPIRTAIHQAYTGNDTGQL